MTIVILCVLLVAAGIGYYGAGVHQKKKAAKEAAQEDKEITLYSLKADDLVSVHVVSDKADMTYTKENGVWKDAKDNQYPIDQEKINDILDDVAEVKASKLVVTDPEERQSRNDKNADDRYGIGCCRRILCILWE